MAKPVDEVRPPRAEPKAIFINAEAVAGSQGYPDETPQ